MIGTHEAEKVVRNTIRMFTDRGYENIQNVYDPSNLFPPEMLMLLETGASPDASDSVDIAGEEDEDKALDLKNSSIVKLQKAEQDDEEEDEDHIVIDQQVKSKSCSRSSGSGSGSKRKRSDNAFVMKPSHSINKEMGQEEDEENDDDDDDDVDELDVQEEDEDEADDDILDDYEEEEEEDLDLDLEEDLEEDDPEDIGIGELKGPAAIVRKMMVVTATDPRDRNQRVGVFLIVNNFMKLGVKMVAALSEVCQSLRIEHVVLITTARWPHKARMTMNHRSSFTNEFFMCSDLYEVVVDHFIVPKHRCLGKEEQAKILAAYPNRTFKKINPKTDPVARYYRWWPLGSLIEILNNSRINGFAPDYRVVAHPLQLNKGGT